MVVEGSSQVCDVRSISKCTDMSAPTAPGRREVAKANRADITDNVRALTSIVMTFIFTSALSSSLISTLILTCVYKAQWCFHHPQRQVRYRAGLRDVEQLEKADSVSMCVLHVHAACTRAIHVRQVFEAARSQTRSTLWRSRTSSN